MESVMAMVQQGSSSSDDRSMSDDCHRRVVQRADGMSALAAPSTEKAGRSSSYWLVLAIKFAGHSLSFADL